MATPKIYRYSQPALVHEAVDFLQTEFAGLHYLDEQGNEVPWFSEIFGLAEQGKNNYPLGWSEEISEHISVISNDNNVAQCFFTDEGSQFLGANQWLFNVGIYIWIDEVKLNKIGRGTVLNNLIKNISYYVFESNNNPSIRGTILSYETSQTINNTILQEGSALFDANFNPFKDNTLYARIVAEIPITSNCEPIYQATNQSEC